MTIENRKKQHKSQVLEHQSQCQGTHHSTVFRFEAFSATLELELAERLLNDSSLWQESRSSNSNIGALPAQQPFDSVSSVLLCSEWLGIRSQQRAEDLSFPCS